MNSKTPDRRCIKTKNAIHNAFLSLITEKDYDKIKVTDIVKRANVGRKTFYLHYESKDDVLKEIQDDFYQSGDARISKYIQKGERYDIHHIFEDLDGLIMIYLNFLKACAKRDSYHLLEDIVKGSLERIISSVLKERYHIADEVTPSYVTFYSSGISSLFISWLRNEIPMSLEQVTEVAEKVCFEGADSLIKVGVKRQAQLKEAYLYPKSLDFLLSFI